MKAFVAINILQICFILAVIFRCDSLLSDGVSTHLLNTFIDPSLAPSVSKSSACLFIISTSHSDQDYILSQFTSYDDDPSVVLWMNVYDDENSSMDITEAESFAGGKTIIKSHIPGLKQMLWEQVAPQYTGKYGYLYFLDDDMVFDKAMFAFDQFRWLVQHTDAVIASPKIMRKAAPTNTGGNNAASAITRGGGKLLRVKAKHRRLVEDGDGGGWSTPPVGLYKEENTADKVAAIVKVIEIGSFMIKAEAWNFFRENIFVPSSKSDCGPDCVWCKVFEQEEARRYGRIPCLRALHVGIMHLDTRSYGKRRSFIEHSEQCSAAVDKYFERTKQRYGMNNQNLMQCRDRSMDFISLQELGIA